ncbi:MAG: sulfotransferase family protein, partial [Rubrobacteraceae bacterium]
MAGRVIPNFFIVGAAKAGTTSMYQYLERHPDVYMSSVKEPHWFSRVEPNPARDVRPVTSEEEYLGLFEGWRGESFVSLG